MHSTREQLTFHQHRVWSTEAFELTLVQTHVSLLSSDRLQVLITETVVFKSNNMKAVVNAQHIEANRALCGCGKFMLALSHAKHRLIVDRWKGMTAG